MKTQEDNTKKVFYIGIFIIFFFAILCFWYFVITDRVHQKAIKTVYDYVDLKQFVSADSTFYSSWHFHTGSIDTFAIQTTVSYYYSTEAYGSLDMLDSIKCAERVKAKVAIQEHKVEMKNKRVLERKLRRITKSKCE